MSANPETVAALLPLFMATPLVAAALGVIFPWAWVRNTLAVGVPVVGAAAGVGLVVFCGRHGAVGENVGGYVPGVAIAFAADTFSGVMIAVTSVVCVAAVWFAMAVGEAAASRFFLPLVLMLMGGVYGALCTADLFNLFVCIEVMLLPSYALLAMTGTIHRLRSGRVFILVNLVTSAVLVVGVTMIYATAGTPNLPALAGAAHGHGPVVVAGALVLIALSIKAGLFPVHTWLPRTYPYTSPAVMALFSGLHTKVALYAMFRIYSVMFGVDSRWQWLIVAVCIPAMLLGAFAGMAETTMRSMLAYQMVGGMPLIVVALAFGPTPTLLAAAIFYMVHHMVTVSSLVLSSGAIEETYGTGRLRVLAGIMRSDPVVAAVFVAGALSIVGLPPFSGVVGKLWLVLALAQQGSTAAWLVLAAVVVAGMGSLLTMLKLWREVFWGRPMDPKVVDPALAVPARVVWPSAVMMVMSLGMVLGAGPAVTVANGAAQALLDVQGYQAAVFGGQAPVAEAAPGGAGLAGAGLEPAQVPVVDGGKDGGH